RSVSSHPGRHHGGLGVSGPRARCAPFRCPAMFQTLPLPATTDLLALQRLAPQRYPLLMESTASGTAQGRWDLLLMGNGEALALHADGVVRDADGVAH